MLAEGGKKFVRSKLLSNSRNEQHALLLLLLVGWMAGLEEPTTHDFPPRWPFSKNFSRFHSVPKGLELGKFTLFSLAWLEQSGKIDGGRWKWHSVGVFFFRFALLSWTLVKSFPWVLFESTSGTIMLFCSINYSLCFLCGAYRAWQVVPLLFVVRHRSRPGMALIKGNARGDAPLAMN